MPFEKGHTLKTPANTAGAMTGAARGVKAKLARARSLAGVLREDVCDEYICRYLMELITGSDPRVTMRDVDPKTGRDRRGPKTAEPRGGAQPPTLEQSLQALQQLILRRDGQPAQSIHIQQEIRAAALVGHTAIDREKLAAMPLEERRALLAAHAKLLAAPAAMDVVDAEIVEPAPVPKKEP